MLDTLHIRFQKYHQNSKRSNVICMIHSSPGDNYINNVQEDGQNK